MRRLIPLCWAVGIGLIVLAAAGRAWAQTQGTAPTPAPTIRWQPDSLGMSLLSTALFGLLGVVLAIGGFKLFDLVVPFHVEGEVFQKGNIAAAVLVGMVILGICLVVAAAVI